MCKQIIHTLEYEVCGQKKKKKKSLSNILSDKF